MPATSTCCRSSAALFRHRMADARLRTAEAELLGLHRVGDVEGWEIPGRYLEFLRGGSAQPLAEVARHNDQDVRSLAWLLAHLADRLRRPVRAVARRHPATSPGWPARSPASTGSTRRSTASRPPPTGRSSRTVRPTPSSAAVGRRCRTTPRGGRRDAPPTSVVARNGRRSPPSCRAGRALAAPWTTERIAVDRAHLLRRLGRHAEAVRGLGRHSRPARAGSRSSPPSSSPSSASIGCATARARSRP